MLPLCTTGSSAAKRSVTAGTGKTRREASAPFAAPPNPTQPAGTSSARTTQGRRRGLLALPRPKTSSHGTLAIMPPVEKAGNISERERDCDEIVRAQLSYVREALGAGMTNGEPWPETRLFPTAGASCSSVINDLSATCDSQGDGGEDIGENNAGGIEGSSGEQEGIVFDRIRRVRPRPASWGARARDDGCGWVGMWPAGYDDCWGDGDGYLTLKPFPSREEMAKSVAKDQSAEEASAQTDDLRPIPGEQQLPTGSSLADRFLEVFRQLQPARRALKLADCQGPTLGSEETKGVARGAARSAADRTKADYSCSGTNKDTRPLSALTTANNAIAIAANNANPRRGERDDASASNATASMGKRLNVGVEVPTVCHGGSERSEAAEMVEGERHSREINWGEGDNISPSLPESAPCSERVDALERVSTQANSLAVPEESYQPQKSVTASRSSRSERRRDGDRTRGDGAASGTIDLTLDSPPSKPSASKNGPCVGVAKANTSGSFIEGHKTGNKPCVVNENQRPEHAVGPCAGRDSGVAVDEIPKGAANHARSVPLRMVHLSTTRITLTRPHPASDDAVGLRLPHKSSGKSGGAKVPEATVVGRPGKRPPGTFSSVADVSVGGVMGKRMVHRDAGFASQGATSRVSQGVVMTGSAFSSFSSGVVTSDVDSEARRAAKEAAMATLATPSVSDTSVVELQGHKADVAQKVR